MKKTLLLTFCMLSLFVCKNTFAETTTVIIDSISPNKGTPAGGDTISIFGSNLLNTTEVLFGDLHIEAFIVVSDSELKIVSDTGVDTTDIIVTTTEGSSNAVEFTYFAPNLFWATTTDNGNSNGGYTRSFTGQYLTGVDEIYFGKYPAGVVNVISDEEIEVIVPPCYSYTLYLDSVAVAAYSTAGQTGQSTAFYYIDPEITFVESSSSQSESIDSKSIELNIYGSGEEQTEFSYTVSGTATNGVDFTLTDTTIYLDPWDYSYEIEIKDIIDDALIEGDETVTIQISTPYMYNYGYYDTHTFTIIDNDGIPELNSISPSSGTPAGGDTITLHGEYFSHASTVMFGDQAAQIFTIESDSVIKAITPTGVASVDVSVTTPNGTTDSLSFQYFAPNIMAEYTGFNYGSRQGGYNRTFYGKYLTGIEEVYFGNQAATIVTISDSLVEVTVPTLYDIYNEVITVAVSAYAGGQTGTSTDFSYQDPKISFIDSISSQSESIDSAVIQLEIKHNPTPEPISFSYHVSNSTATNDSVDFYLENRTIIVEPNTSSYEIVIKDIIDDNIIEEDETITITIVTPSVNMGQIHKHTFTIIDNDQPEISFGLADSTASEAISIYKIPVVLSEAHLKTVSVDYTISGTATNGDDYTLSDGTLTITAGTTSDSITIADIIDDSIIEDDETIIITLSNATNASLGSKTVYTYTIRDNDLLASAKEATTDIINIYPNPFTSRVYINNTENIKNISIRSIAGYEVYKQKYYGEKDIELNHLEQGIYFFTIEMNTGEQKIFKLIKK